MAAFDTFRKKAVTVLLDTGGVRYQNDVSPLVYGALSNPTLGNIIPKLVAFSPDNTQVWGSLNYGQLKSPKALKNLRNNLADIQAGEFPPPNDFKVVLQWTVKDKPGYHYKGDFVKLDDQKVHLNENGKAIAIPRAKLSDAAIAYAEELVGIEETKKLEAAKPREEAWANSKGLIIQATFISLVDDKITLKLANGKSSSFALNMLSEESIERAQKYAAQ